MPRFSRFLLTPLGALLIASCNGTAHAPSTEWTPGTFEPAGAFASYCQAPRQGTNKYTGQAYPDRYGTSAHEKHFLRAWTHENYLWYDEVDDIDPNSALTTADYFNLLKTNALNASGTPKDKFHFWANEESEDQFVYTGETGGFGIHWAHGGGQDFYVSLVEHNSPAALSGIKRGMLLRQVGDYTLPTNSAEGIKAINQALGAPQLNKNYTLVFEHNAAPHTVTLNAQNVAQSAVYTHAVIPQNGQNIGYLAFNNFQILDGELELKNAFDDFAQQNVTELVLDLRYNGGGFLHIASQLAYQIAGSASQNKLFAGLHYNIKRSQSNYNIPFYGFTTEPLPRPLSSLNLARVYVLTTGNTCSASEAVMNGLRGIGVEVIQIGSTTCGKPYGFNATANCGRRYYNIDFEYVNNQGFSDFGDGFKPATHGDPLSHLITGCQASDDYNHELGDPEETLLKTALYHQQNGQCPSSNPAQKGQYKTSAYPTERKLLRPANQEVLTRYVF